MGKPPRGGRVKTRLSHDIGTAQAATFYRHSARRVLSRLGKDPRWTTTLAVNARPTEQYDCWPAFVPRMGQGTGTLGARMNHVLRHLPRGPVVVIGTDSPHLEPHHIAQAFAALGDHDAAFGPADDGGYWLIGLARRRPAPALFDGVRWSTDHALADTIASLPPTFCVAHLGVMTDVDTGADLAGLRAKMGPMRFGPWPDQPHVPSA